ncbi:probable purine permease 4 [Impatiens glandulifera]|uniref:probable purine permease 4 n=1 Tax=Impatiens glandulifera TaxID=253017 RepID=UPI001FB05E5C|nr:probable purine permease 4 [Impatiens glandulifera]
MEFDQSHYSLTNNNNDNKGKLAILMAINGACLFVGSVSSTLLSKFYFIHNGSSRWVSTLVQSAGFPLLLPFIFLPPYLFPSTHHRKPFACFSRKLLILSILAGFLIGVDNFLFSWGTSYLPVSTSSLLLSSQLAFNLLLSVIIVKQNITFHNLNCVVLLTLASVLLAMGSTNDRVLGLTRPDYFVGFFCTIGAGLLFALYLPLMEMIYRKVDCFAMVVEMQMVMEASATALIVVGMTVANRYEDLGTKESEIFDMGPKAYWWTVVGTTVTWQLSFMGTAGVVFLTTSLTGGVCMTALMAVNVLGGVVVYGDKFSSLKAISTILCGWGFCSYVYGIYSETKYVDVDDEDMSLKTNHDHHRLRMAEKDGV